MEEDDALTLWMDILIILNS